MVVSRAVRCVWCNQHEVVAGVLCGQCASRLCGSTPLCAEQVVWENGPASTEAGLVDCWGRVKLLDSPTVLGRNADGISILEPSVSRVHAAIERTTPGSWQVSDRGSSNGTTVNGKRVNVAPLQSGDILFVGEVGFLFLSPAPSTEPEEEVPQSHPTWTPTPIWGNPND